MASRIRGSRFGGDDGEFAAVLVDEPGSVAEALVAVSLSCFWNREGAEFFAADRLGDVAGGLAAALGREHRQKSEQLMWLPTLLRRPVCSGFVALLIEDELSGENFESSLAGEEPVRAST